MKLNIRWFFTVSLLASLASANSALARPQSYDESYLHCKSVAAIPRTEPNSNGVPTEFIDIYDITIVSADNVDDTLIDRPDGGAIFDAIAVIHNKEIRSNDPSEKARYTDFLLIEGSATVSGDELSLQFQGESNYYRLTVDSNLTTPTASKVQLQFRGDSNDFEDHINTTAAECVDPIPAEE